MLIRSTQLKTQNSTRPLPAPKPPEESKEFNNSDSVTFSYRSNRKKIKTGVGLVGGAAVGGYLANAATSSLVGTLAQVASGFGGAVAGAAVGGLAGGFIGAQVEQGPGSMAGVMAYGMVGAAVGAVGGAVGGAMAGPGTQAVLTTAAGGLLGGAGMMAFMAD